MRRTGLLFALAALSGCRPEAPTVSIEAITMNADGLSYEVHTTPGARVSGGPGFASATADGAGVARFTMPLGDVDQPDYHLSAEVEGTFGSSFGSGVLSLPMTVEEAQMVRPDGSPFLAVVTVTADELTDAGHCLVGGDYGGNNAPIGASGRCGLALRAPAGTRVTFDGVAVDTAQRFETDLGPELAAMQSSMFGVVQQIERSYAVEVTSPSGASARGTLTVSAMLVSPLLRARLGLRAGQPFFDGATPSPDVALLVGPEELVGLVGRGTPARIEGALGTASRIAIATDGATREAPPCTGYHFENSPTEATLARLTTDVELRIYDAATTTEIGHTTVSGPGTGCPITAEAGDVVRDRPTHEALAAAIWAAGR